MKWKTSSPAGCLWPGTPTRKIAVLVGTFIVFGNSYTVKYSNTIHFDASIATLQFAARSTAFHGISYDGRHTFHFSGQEMP